MIQVDCRTHKSVVKPKEIRGNAGVRTASQAPTKMNIQEIGRCMTRGFLDSLKGIYWLYTLDNAQQRAHSERAEFQELRTKGNANASKKISTSNNKSRFSPKHATPTSDDEPRLLNRVGQCSFLNGFVFGASIFIFKNVLIPGLSSFLSLFVGTDTRVWFWLSLILQWTFDSLWVLPVFVLSRLVNALWFQDIGTLAYRYSIGRPKGLANISTFVADNLFSIIIQALFLVQAFVIQIVTTPLTYISDVLFLLHMTLLYSLYSFEYKWVQMGWPLHHRLAFLETNWPYFVGFGLPLALLTWWPNDFYLSGCIFSIVFPLFIIAGNEAQVQLNTGGSAGQLRLFAPVVAISNTLFKYRGNQRAAR